MSKPPARQKSRSKEPSNTGTRRLFLVLAGLAGLGLVVFTASLGVGIALENNNAFCGACHTQPETTYLQRLQQAPPADLASFHITNKQVRCIDCHSGSGIGGRISAEIGMGARDGLAFISGHYTSPAVTTMPEGIGSCTKCHDPGQLVSVSQNSGMEERAGHYHDARFEAAWQNAGGPVNPCTACHPAHPQIGGAETIYTSLDTAQRGCETCHAALGAEGG